MPYVITYVYQGDTVKVIEPNQSQWKLFRMDGFANLGEVQEALHIGLDLKDSDLAKTLFGATFVNEGAASDAITKSLANDCKHQ